MRRFLAVSLLAVLSISACTEADPSAYPEFGLLETSDVRFEMVIDSGTPSCDQNDQKACFTSDGYPGILVCMNGEWSYCHTICVDSDVTPCLTSCATRGTQTCLAGEWSNCKPPAETCNAIDDDCDGEVDESLGLSTCGTGECTHEEPICENGKTNLCNPYEGMLPEICDKLDNNCDGQTDEGLLRQCATDCDTGIETCKDGEWSGCTASEPKDEVCDGIDNDCDGKTDEDTDCVCKPGQVEPCGNDIGECSAGTKVCSHDGHWGNCQGAGYNDPAPESCNLADDDCDGRTDEDLFRQCKNACGTGTELCQNGEWAGCTAGTPGQEVCDGLDNDCNGVIDDLAAPDDYENNDECEMAYDLGTIVENGTSVELTAAIVPSDDTDWYQIEVEEIDDLVPPCGDFDPMGPEICYVAVIGMEGLDEGSDFRIQMFDTNCNGAWYESDETNTIAVAWTGYQMVDDAATFMIMVDNSAIDSGLSGSCHPYTIKASFYGFCFDEETGQCPWEQWSLEQ